MNSAEQFLVILLSSFLAIFLILSIIVLLKLRQILDHINNITAKAENIADQAEQVSEFFQKTAGTVAVTKLVANIVSAFKGDKGKGSGREQ